MKLYELFIRLFFPLRCLGCDSLIPIDSKVPFCNKCFMSLKSAQTSSKLSVPPDHCDEVWVLFRYSEDTVKHTVFHMKKYFSTPFCDFFISKCNELFSKTDILDNLDLITFVTRSTKEKLKSGVDQAEMMAKAISKITKIPYAKTLKRVREADVQHTLTREERLKNVKGLFHSDKDLKGKRILLLDDVFTTGATISECAKVLKKAGAVSVKVLTFSC